MKVTVLRPLPYAADHIRAVTLAPGEAEIADELVPGLVAEGYLAEPDQGAAPAEAVAPSAPEPPAVPVVAEPDAPAEPTQAEPTDAPAAAVEIPADWRDLKWPALRSLALKVSDEPIRNHDDAVAAIELELERRTGQP